MRVTEIFRSIDGEGLRTGLPATFVRLFGCNLNCSYCDTQYSKGEEAAKQAYTMSIEEIVDECIRLEAPCVTVTGGEPLMHPGIENLLSELIDAGFFVNVETNGTFPIPERFRHCVSIIFTMDYKCPSSNMEQCMNRRVIESLRPFDVLKFVVGSEDDMDTMVEVLDSLDTAPSVYVSPVFGKIEPQEIVAYVLTHKLWNVRVQVQLHKVIWAPDKRGV